jgi:hypothetical protein
MQGGGGVGDFNLAAARQMLEVKPHEYREQCEVKTTTVALLKTQVGR